MGFVNAMLCAASVATVHNGLHGTARFSHPLRLGLRALDLCVSYSVQSHNSSLSQQIARDQVLRAAAGTQIHRLQVLDTVKPTRAAPNHS